jgi:hypothetical protein
LGSLRFDCGGGHGGRHHLLHASQTEARIKDNENGRS